MAPRQKVTIEAQREIEKLALAGWGAAQIKNHLERREDLQGLLPDSLRTYQRYVRSVTPADTSQIWNIKDSEPEHVPAILEVLAATVRRSGGQKPTITTAEAGWIVAVRSAAPDLPPREVYPIARLYLLRESKGQTSPDLDALLGFTPWRGPGPAAAYRAAVTARQIPWPPVFWAMTKPYRRMLHEMGFYDACIEESQGDYERLLAITRQLETAGSIDFGGKED